MLIFRDTRAFFPISKKSITSRTPSMLGPSWLDTCTEWRQYPDRRERRSETALGVAPEPLTFMTLNRRLGVAVLLVVVTAGPPSAQTTRTKQVMRDKLDHSQQILEAVVTSDWQLLERESRAMALVVRDPAWSALAVPGYMRYSEAFLRATNDLAEAARSRDLESASLGLVSLTTSCVSCHRYLARARIVTTRPDAR